MTNTQQYSPPDTGVARGTPGVVRVRLRVLHLIAGSLLGAYPYLPATVPGHSALRWSLMIVFIPAVTASGLWLWKQAAVRRWLRARAIRRERLPSEASAPTAKMFTPGSTDSSDRFPDWRST